MRSILLHRGLQGITYLAYFSLNRWPRQGSGWLGTGASDRSNAVRVFQRRWQLIFPSRQIGFSLSN